MESLLVEIPLAMILIAMTPLLLLMWIGLMATFGEMTWSEWYRHCRPHDLVKAKIVDQHLIEAQVSAGRTTMISFKYVYRLRYEYEQSTYEVEYLVINDEHVGIDKQAKTFLLYVPKANPANATADAPNTVSPFSVLVLILMGYLTWKAAPALLLGYVP